MTKRERKEVTPEQRMAAMRVLPHLGVECPDDSKTFDCSWGELNEYKRSNVTAMEAILDRAQEDGRESLNYEETAAYGYLEALLNNTNHEMDKRQESGNKDGRGVPDTTINDNFRQFGPAASKPQGSGTAFLVSPESGKRMPVFAGTESMFGGDGGEATVGQLACAAAIGDFSGLSPSLKASVTSGGDGGGQYMLSPESSGRVVDLARSASVVMRAGAQTTPMTTSEMNILRVLSDPSVTARREMQAIDASKPTFGRFTLQTRMYSALVPITIEQLEDSANGPAVVEQTMRSALGLAMDQAILKGAGGPEVLGIVNSDEANEQTGVGTPSGWADVSQSVGKVLEANYDGDPSGLAWVHNPRDAGTYDRLTGTDDQPLRPTPWVEGLNRYATTSLEPDSGETEMIVGDFSQILVGMRTGGVMIDVLDSGQAMADGETINATTQFVRFLRARVRFDAVLMRPDWFTVLRGVTAS